ncbi:MAG: dipeptidase [Bacilli bacterium]|nr:dipeptidase [Bacilli bacterium]
MIIDLHCDTIKRLEEEKEKGFNMNLKDNNLNVDLKKMKKSNYMLQCFAMFVPLKEGNPFEICMKMIDRYYEEIKSNKDLILPAFSYNDIVENNKKGLMSSLLTIEEGGVIKGNLSFLRDFYRLGVRLITLTWNYENEIGYPNIKIEDNEIPNFYEPNVSGGLTEFGIEVVKEMNRLGMIIDVSHLSDKGFYDVIKYSKKPIVASHSNSRSICRVVRNMTDDMLIALAKNNGVVGINFCDFFLKDFEKNEKPFSYISDIIKHIKYIKEVIGIDYIAIGTDFDGISPNLEIKNAGEMDKLILSLKKEGFTNEEIEKISYKNALRVFKEVLI